MGRYLTKTVLLVLMLHFLISSSSAFCEAMGFTIQTANSSVEEPYYGNTTTLEPVEESLIKSEIFALIQDRQKLVRAMILVRLISLLVTLFAIVLHDFTRWRNNQQHMQAFLEREARRLIRNM